MLDAQLLQHPLHGVVLHVLGGGHLSAVVREDSFEADAVLRIEQVDALEPGEHHAQALHIHHHLAPGQPGATVHEGHQVAAILMFTRRSSQMETFA